MAADQQSIACTLTAGGLRDRLAWIATLNRDALRGYDRADLTLRLRYAPQAMRQVEELMRQEQACCAFLTFEMHEESDAVTLTIKAPEEARATVEALFEAFLPAKGQIAENQLRPLQEAVGRFCTAGGQSSR